MVTRAVSKLQQLAELQEELQLPPGGPAGAPAAALGAGGGDRPQSQPDQALNPRRSLDLALSAISEAPPEEEGGVSTAPHPGRGRRLLARGGAGSSSKRRRGGEARDGEMGRLRRLQEQLQLNMLEVTAGLLCCFQRPLRQ